LGEKKKKVLEELKVNKINIKRKARGKSKN
jgi:hypothetical protein